MEVGDNDDIVEDETEGGDDHDDDDNVELEVIWRVVVMMIL